MALPPELAAIDRRLNEDLLYFGVEAPLMVLDKGGRMVPFRPNRAQRYIHQRLEEQLKRTGKVRALILKGRQEGCSQYLTARVYHKTTRHPGISALLISHEGKATSHLLSKVELYQNHIDPRLRPEVGAANRNQFYFSALESRFSVGTAGNEDVGRSGTNQIFHWSETGYTDNDHAIQDGAMQTVPNLPGTEIYLESTGNGQKGLFYTKCTEALHGRGDYQLIFIPWWWMDEYEAESTTYEAMEDEEAYARENLTEYGPATVERKLMWRRNTVHEFAIAAGGSMDAGLRKFREVYPANPVEAFQSSGKGMFEPGAITAAKKSTVTDENAPLVMGIDSAGSSPDGDRTIIAFRRGRHFLEYIKVPKQPNMDMAVAGIAIKEIKARGVDMAFIDVGYGHGTLDRMTELGFGSRVIGVHFGEAAIRSDIYLNKRAEMIITTAGWVNGGNVRIPDDEEVHADLAIMPQAMETSTSKQYVPSKKDIKKLYNGKSTDILDALGLTFSYPVSRRITGAVGDSAAGGGWAKKNGGKSPLSSANRFRGRR